MLLAGLLSHDGLAVRLARRVERDGGRVLDDERRVDVRRLPQELRELGARGLEQRQVLELPCLQRLDLALGLARRQRLG